MNWSLLGKFVGSFSTIDLNGSQKQVPQFKLLNFIKPVHVGSRGQNKELNSDSPSCIFRLFWSRVLLPQLMFTENELKIFDIAIKNLNLI